MLTSLKRTLGKNKEIPVIIVGEKERTKIIKLRKDKRGSSQIVFRTVKNSRKVSSGLWNNQIIIRISIKTFTLGLRILVYIRYNDSCIIIIN